MMAPASQTPRCHFRFLNYSNACRLEAFTPASNPIIVRSSPAAANRSRGEANVLSGEADAAIAEAYVPRADGTSLTRAVWAICRSRVRPV